DRRHGMTVAQRHHATDGWSPGWGLAREEAADATSGDREAQSIAPHPPRVDPPPTAPDIRAVDAHCGSDAPMHRPGDQECGQEQHRPPPPTQKDRKSVV